VRGIRLNLRGASDYAEYAKPSWRALFDRAHERGWHLECYVDPGRLSEITPAVEGSPIAIVFDHFGVPGANAAAVDATFAAAARMARSREVWVKLSAPYRVEGMEPGELARRWLDAVGPQRLVWGSDWPWTGHEAQRFSYGKLRSRLDEWVDPSLASAILWDNPARLYGFG
jgi:predicted TIM-barrel fold metal-dependent hydrolase